MNIYGPREIRRRPIVDPKWIREPSGWLGEKNQITGAGMIEGDFGAFITRKNTAHTRGRREKISHPCNIGPIGDVDVCQLMVANGKAAARQRIELFAARSGPCEQQPRALPPGRGK